MSITAMKLALEALELNNAEWKSLADSGDTGYWRAEDQSHYKQTNEAIIALRTAIEQAEKQEPVAWMKEGGFRSQVTFDWRIAKREGLTIPLYSRPQLACAPTHEPVATMTVRHTKNKTEIGYGPASKGYDLPNGEYKLYTTPPAAPVQERNFCERCGKRLGDGHIHTCTPPAAPVQEPVGLIESLKDAQPCCGQYEICHRACTPRGKFLGHRDAQRQWVGLTDEEVVTIELSLRQYVDADRYDLSLRDFANAIEAKLREKNGAAPAQDFRERLAQSIEQMPFGDTAQSFATYVRNFK